MLACHRVGECSTCWEIGREVQVRIGLAALVILVCGCTPFEGDTTKPPKDEWPVFKGTNGPVVKSADTVGLNPTAFGRTSSNLVGATND